MTFAARGDAEPVVDRVAVDLLLRESAVFGTLPDDVRALLLGELRLRTVESGDVVIRQGDPADGMYIVAGGRLQVVLEREDGERVVLREEGYGAVIGEMAIINDAPRSANVVALRECHLLFLSNEGFQRVIAAYPEALRTMTSVLVRKLAATAHGRQVTSPVRSIVVLPLDDDALGAEVARSLSPTLDRIVDAHRVVTDARRAVRGRHRRHPTRPGPVVREARGHVRRRRVRGPRRARRVDPGVPRPGRRRPRGRGRRHLAVGPARRGAPRTAGTADADRARPGARAVHRGPAQHAPVARAARRPPASSHPPRPRRGRRARRPVSS